jgi:predicted nucleotidyltransferase
MRYSINEIKNKIEPIAKRHRLAAVYLFGSYARHEANEGSDIDFLVDTNNSGIVSAFDMGGLFNDLEDCFGTDNVDVLTNASLYQYDNGTARKNFCANVEKDKVKIYERRG